MTLGLRRLGRTKICPSRVSAAVAVPFAGTRRCSATESVVVVTAAQRRRPARAQLCVAVISVDSVLKGFVSLRMHRPRADLEREFMVVQILMVRSSVTTARAAHARRWTIEVVDDVVGARDRR